MSSDLLNHIRISGVTVPGNKKVFVSLSYIYGIGVKTAKSICDKLKVGTDRNMNQLSADELSIIRNYIDSNLKVEGDLRNQVSQNIKLKIAINSYQGIRHRSRLPVRGQNTKTNARTRKGRKKNR